MGLTRTPGQYRRNEQAAVEMLYRMQRATRDRMSALMRLCTRMTPFERDAAMLHFYELGRRFGEARTKLLSGS